MRRCAVALAMLLVIAGCSGGGSSDGAGGDATPAPGELRDPSARGPYAVGLQHMTFTRTTDRGEVRPLDTWIWYPADGTAGEGAVEGAQPLADGGPFPVVIFSHGSGGQPQFQRFFTEHLASWGYVVAAPPHPGNTSDDCVLCPVDAILRSAPERPVDVRFVYDELLALRDDPESALGQLIDPDRAAIAGHSFGGWTAVYVADDARFDAAIAMAPGAPQTLIGHARRITMPMLIFNSEKDSVVDPAGVKSLSEAVPEAISLTYIAYPAGTHLAYIDNCFDCSGLKQDRAHELTLRYATAFLERYLRGDKRYAAYLGESVGTEAVAASR